MNIASKQVDYTYRMTIILMHFNYHIQPNIDNCKCLKEKGNTQKHDVGTNPTFNRTRQSNWTYQSV